MDAVIRCTGCGTDRTFGGGKANDTDVGFNACRSMTCRGTMQYSIPQMATATKGKEDFSGTINGNGYKGSMDNPAKPPMSLIPPTVKRWIARVLGFGATKYARGQWMQGMNYSEIIDGVQRHIDAWQLGEDADPESGMNHLAHAMCGLSFLSWYIDGPDAETYKRFDDRLFVGAERLKARQP